MIEILESRIAPAAVFNYTDIDGDKVTIHTSKGFNFNLALAAHVAGGQLQLLDLSSSIFTDSDVSFTVTQVGLGDGLAAVGKISGGAHALGNVMVKGDLGVIESGDLTSLSVRSFGRYGIATQAPGAALESDINGSLQSLTVTNDLANAFLNVSGRISTINIGGSLVDGLFAHGGSIAAASISSVRIGGNIQGSSVDHSGSISSASGITTVVVGGSLVGGSGAESGMISTVEGIRLVLIGHNVIGGAGSQSGRIEAGAFVYGVRIFGSLAGGAGPDSGTVFDAHTFGAVSIGDDLTGGAGAKSGVIEAGGDVTQINIGGSLVGGSGAQAGEVRVGGNFAGLSIAGSVIGGSGGGSGAVVGLSTIGTITLGHSLIGGSGVDSGEINLASDLASATIGGSVFGGTNTRAGSIISGGDLTSLAIGHDLIGASITTGSLTDSGYIQGERIGSVTIGGSVLAGSDESTGALINNASIKAVHVIGSIVVKGNVTGTDAGGGNVTQVVFSGGGGGFHTIFTDPGIGSVTIGGAAEHLDILAGYDPSSSPVDGAAQIGTVHVSGDWIAGSIVAGAQDVKGNGFGNADDKLIGGGSASIARIASIIVDGIVEGTPAGESSADHFGFESHVIGSVQINGLAVPVISPVELSPLTRDMTIRLV